MRVLVKFVWTFFFVSTLAFASAEPSSSSSKGENKNVKLFARLYLTTTCPNCQNEDAFFRQLEKEKPWLQIKRYSINVDKKALEQFQQELKQYHTDDYSVPALFFCDSRWVGFDKPETTGQAISRGLEYCYQQITKKGYLDAETKAVLKQWSNSQTLSPGFMHIKNPLVFIPMMSILDAFSSCSIFVLLGLFSFLWLYKEKSVLWGLGILYLFMVAVVHHYQQAHTIFFYQVFSWLRIPAIITGAALIAYVLYIYHKKTNIKPGIVIPILVGLTAFIIEAYQQTCLPNYSLVFTHWLDLQNLSFLHEKIYIIFYHFIYILPLVLIMAFIIYCRVNHKVERLKPLLVCLAWCLLFLMGLIMIVYPTALANLLFSLITLIVSLIAAFVTVRKSSQFNKKKEND